MYWKLILKSRRFVPSWGQSGPLCAQLWHPWVRYSSPFVTPGVSYLVTNCVILAPREEKLYFFYVFWYVWLAEKIYTENWSLKFHRFVPFGANLSKFGPNLTSLCSTWAEDEHCSSLESGMTDFGTKSVRLFIDIKWDKYRIFKDQFSVYFNSQSQNIMKTDLKS